MSAGAGGRVVIVGGGLAGLAAAVGLAGRDLPVTLLESRQRLGGRASSFVDPVTGRLVDNCQHISMECCTNLADFCRRIGVGDRFRRERSIALLGRDGRLSTLGAGPLPMPAPFHLGWSFARSRYLTWADKLRIAYGMLRLALVRRPDAAQTFGGWLRAHGQSPRTIDRFWSTVLVSALNVPVDRMDVGHARKVMVDGLMRNRAAYEMMIPAAPLGELFGEHLRGWLVDRGVDVRLGAGVRSLASDASGAIRGVRLATGEELACDRVVLAVPFDRAPGLVPEPLRSRLPELAAADDLRPSPISCIHLWFDRKVCPFESVALVGRTMHWVFAEDDGAGGQYLKLVVSASNDFDALDKHQILDLARAELAELWPASAGARLERWWVVTEHAATFAVEPGIESRRPPQRTGVEGLYLAGDWTATGWPATMEGAVRSGYLAAESLLADLGQPAELVRPDLPPNLLTRLLPR